MQWPSCHMCNGYFFHQAASALPLWRLYVIRKTHHIFIVLILFPLKHIQAKRKRSIVPLHRNCSMASTGRLPTQLETHRPLSFPVGTPTFSLEAVTAPVSLMDPGVAGHPSVWEVVILRNTLGCVVHGSRFFPLCYNVRTAQQMLVGSAVPRSTWKYKYPDLQERMKSKVEYYDECLEHKANCWAISIIIIFIMHVCSRYFLL